jgi:hypothetical protein
MVDKSWKLLLERVRQILWETWDPIGVNAHAEAVTEYDSYAPGVVSLLIHDCTSAELDLHLSRIETNDMGLSQLPAGARASAVAALLALRSETA